MIKWINNMEPLRRVIILFFIFLLLYALMAGLAYLIIGPGHPRLVPVYGGIAGLGYILTIRNDIFFFINNAFSVTADAAKKGGSIAKNEFDKRFAGIENINPSDLLGKKRDRQLFERAEGEYHSGNFQLALGYVEELFKYSKTDFKAYNLRAQCYVQQGEHLLALKDAKMSVELEPNIDLNSIGYGIRNEITQMIKNDEI
jgi:tetratricopeptide (TPR) repeat protein